ncbi:MAG: hypothetical protein GF404_08665 [candidate division Zixibacteria bacterium]|nr:hypothetical protein [candidate division Zixibacteria bacterium]
MLACLFVSDLHGLLSRYDKLFNLIVSEIPRAVFIAGDILPSGMFMRYQTSDIDGDFIDDYLAYNLRLIRNKLNDRYPDIYLIFGNDDPRIEEQRFIEYDEEGLWHYMHTRKKVLEEFIIYGYACVPPTPFMLKDWERYDVSRYLDPLASSPEEGSRTVAVNSHRVRFGTIKEDLEHLAGNDDLSTAVFLFHTPPYNSKLDLGDLDGKMVDHVPLDPHLGSIAVERFIKSRQPWLTLHGHIHESTRLTGSWQELWGRTIMFNGAHDGPELAVIRFDLKNPASATREII